MSKPKKPRGIRKAKGYKPGDISRNLYLSDAGKRNNCSTFISPAKSAAICIWPVMHTFRETTLFPVRRHIS